MEDSNFTYTLMQPWTTLEKQNIDTTNDPPINMNIGSYEDIDISINRVENAFHPPKNCYSPNQNMENHFHFM